MECQYSQLLDPFCWMLAESNQKSNFLTERHLQAIWLEQKYFKNLTTPDGQTIEVISPGIWNAEAGPDFRKALIKINSVEMRGDIEIHLSDENWHYHQHHLDKRYNDVVLHVSLWEPKTAKTLTTSDGRPLVQTYLENCLTISHNRLIKLIDLDLYPYKKFLGSGRCSQSLFRSLPEARIICFFQNAAHWRLAQKRSFLKEHLVDPAWLLAGGIAMALGYKNNALAFLELFTKLVQFIDRGEKTILALCLGMCGFFENRYFTQWLKSEVYLQLYETWVNLKIREPLESKLVLCNTRPLNHPVRRLAWLSKFICDPTATTLYNTLCKTWQSHWPELKGPKNHPCLRKKLFGLLPGYQDTYWNSHYNFECESRDEFLPLIGEDLKKIIMINAFFPLLQEEIHKRSDPQEMEAFAAFYANWPAAKNSKTKYLVHRFFGDTPKGTVMDKAMMEQGAYQLHRDFCVHFEASCEGCPFVDRFSLAYNLNCSHKT